MDYFNKIISIKRHTIFQDANANIMTNFVDTAREWQKGIRSVFSDPETVRHMFHPAVEIKARKITCEVPIVEPFILEYTESESISPKPHGFEFDFFLLLPEIFYVFALIVLILYCLSQCLSGALGFPSLSRNVVFMSTVILGITLSMYLNGLELLGVSNVFFVRKDTYSILVGCIILFFAVLIMVASYTYNDRNNLFSFEYCILILLSILSMLLMVGTVSTISLYLLLELQSISLYVLTAFSNRKRYSIEAGIKYFIIGSLSSQLLLLGIVLLYGFTGLSQFDDLVTFMINLHQNSGMLLWNGLEVSIILFTIGLLFKIYCAPFHFWVVDIYDGSPLSTTIFIACIPPIALFYMFFRIYICLFAEFHHIIESLILLISISTIVSGSIGGVFQLKIRRIIAYSSITNTGICMLPSIHLDMESLSVGLMYILVYTMNLFTTFVLLSNLNILDDIEPMDTLNQFGGLVQQNRFYSLLLSVNLFAAGGLPPFNIFFYKSYLLSNMLLSDNYVLSFIIIGSTLLSAYMYIRIIKSVLYDEQRVSIVCHPIPYPMYILCVLCVYMQAFVSINPDFFVTLGDIMSMELLCAYTDGVY